MPTILIRKIFFDKIKFDENYHIIGDFDLVLRLSAVAEIDCVQSPVAIYRRHNKNLSHLNRDRHIKELKNWIEKNQKKEIFKKKNLDPIREMIKYLEIVNRLKSKKKTAAFKQILSLPLGSKKILFFIALEMIFAKKDSKLLMKKKILITGGTGFLGYHLINACIKKNFKVTSVSTSEPKKIRFLKKVKYLTCKLEDKSKLKKIIKTKFDYVINFAGHVVLGVEIVLSTIQAIGCKNLCEILIEKKLRPRLFIQIGSSLEYGKLKSPHDETMKTKLTNVYGLSKFLATKYLIGLFKKIKFPVTIIRLYQVYGTHQDSNRLIPIVINNCLKNKIFPCSHGKQMRDFIYVDDVVKAIFKTFKTKAVIGEIVNIGYGKTQKIKNLINSFLLN